MPTTFLTKRDLLQVHAFQMFFRLNDDLPVQERFVHALISSCDEVFRKADEKLITEWLEKYSKRRNLGVYKQKFDCISIWHDASIGTDTFRQKETEI